MVDAKFDICSFIARCNAISLMGMLVRDLPLLLNVHQLETEM